MSANTAIYDLGEIHTHDKTAAPARRSGRRESAATVGHPSVLPGLAASASLFVPGSGHLMAREGQAALFFSSTIGFVVASGWALWQTRDSLLPTLRLLEIAPWTLAVAFAVLYFLGAGLHVFGALDAYAARRRTSLPRTAHPIVALLFSALVPGWGQVLTGRRGRAALFLSCTWMLGAAWLLALPPIRVTLAQLGLPLPIDAEVLDRFAPVALLSVTGMLWAIALYDAAASARSDQR